MCFTLIYLDGGCKIMWSVKSFKCKGDEEVSQQEDVEELGDEYSCSKEAHGEEDVEMLGHVEGEG